MARRVGDGEGAARTLKEARQFRAMLREMAERLSEGRTNMPQATLEQLNRSLRAREAYSEGVRTKDSDDTRFRPRLDEPAHLLVAIAESARRLLSEGDPALLRECENPCSSVPG